MRGIIVKTTGGNYTVESEGKNYICRMKGTFKLKDIDYTNPAAVGDWVQFEEVQAGGVGLIHTIEERKNYIIRKSVKLSKQSQILACNLDAAGLMITIASPRTSTGFIDRFIATAEAYHIPVFLIFNKIDLYESPDLKTVLSEMLSIYQSLNYECFEISVLHDKNLEALKDKLKNKVTLISGHSGVGKTSLISKVEPDLNLKIASISLQHQKGVHTTTFAEMIKLKSGGYVVDTPGIAEFGTVDFVKEEISHYFKEMLPLITSCKFNNCLHEFELQCAVKNAVNEGKIHPSRYYNYLSILHNEDIFR